MKIYRSIDSVSRIKGSCYVAIGVFDGVHKGHQALINKMIHDAQGKDVRTMVFTFLNHPLSVLAPAYRPRRITTPGQQAEHFRRLGVDILTRIKFDETLAQITPEQFVDEIVRHKLHGVRVYCGNDFQFGRNGKGSTDFLKSYGKKRDIATVEVQPIQQDKTIISSTMIRQLLLRGKVEQAARALGHPFEMEGKVVKGRGVGSDTLGFPTANLRVYPGMVIPARGVYAARVQYAGSIYGGMMNVGQCPTIPKKRVTVEVHVFDFKKNIRGKKLAVSMIKYIRNEQRFHSVDRLKQQMRDDREKALRALDTVNIS